MTQQKNIPTNPAELKEATDAYAGLVDSYPDNVNYLEHYAELCLASNKPATALEVLQRLHSILQETAPKKARELAARHPQLGQICASIHQEHNYDRLYPSLCKAFGKLWLRLHQRTLREGEVLYRQGETGDTLALIITGELAVFIEDETEERILLNLVQERDIIGEACFLNPGKRVASIVANCKTTIVELPRQKLLTWLISNPETQEQLEETAHFRHMLRLISSNATLKTIPMNLRQYMAQNASLLHYPEHSIMYEAGATFDGVSLIISGEAYYRMETKSGKKIKLESVPCGSLIGDAAVVREATAPATLVTTKQLAIAHIPTRIFTAVIAAYPPLKETLNQHADEQRVRIMHTISQYLQASQ